MSHTGYMTEATVNCLEKFRNNHSFVRWKRFYTDQRECNVYNFYHQPAPQTNLFVLAIHGDEHMGTAGIPLVTHFSTTGGVVWSAFLGL